MDEDTRVIISVRVAKAREDIETARDLIGLGRYRVSATRSYYAVFTVTTAVLLTQDIVRDKHAGVQSAFGQYFVQSGHIEREYGRIFSVARKAREESDYADQITFTREYAEKHLADAERFVARMEQYLKHVGAIV